MISIDWGTRIIYIPQSYCTFVSGIVYELDVNQLFLDLKDHEDSEDGQIYPDILTNNPEATLSGDTFARVVKIINGYTVTFEDVGSHWTVKCTGANHNLADVTNFDAVNLIVNNSAGLIRSDNTDQMAKDIRLIKTLNLLKL